MSKVKQAELDDSALFIATKLLTEIETAIDHTVNFASNKDAKRLKILIDAYNQLKPYF